MRKSNLAEAIDALEAIRGIAARQDYNTSVDINKKLIKVIPLLEAEYAKMDKDNYEVASPMYKEILPSECEEVNKTMEEFINNYIAELVDNDLTVLDYGIIYVDRETKRGFVKYDRR